LDAKGARVVIDDLNPVAGETLEGLKAVGGEGLFVPANVPDGWLPWKALCSAPTAACTAPSTTLASCYRAFRRRRHREYRLLWPAGPQIQECRRI
jgi:hypothetical protein